MKLVDHKKLARLMREQKKGARTLGLSVGLGKSTMDRLRRGEHKSTREDVAKAIERELNVEPGTLFVMPAVSRVPCDCHCHGAVAA